MSNQPTQTSDEFILEAIDMMAESVPSCDTPEKFKRVLKEALARYATSRVVPGERMSFDLTFTCDYDPSLNIALNVTFDDTPK